MTRRRQSRQASQKLGAPSMLLAPWERSRQPSITNFCSTPRRSGKRRELVLSGVLEGAATAAGDWPQEKTGAEKVVSGVSRLVLLGKNADNKAGKALDEPSVIQDHLGSKPDCLNRSEKLRTTVKTSADIGPPSTANVYWASLAADGASPRTTESALCDKSVISAHCDKSKTACQLDGTSGDCSSLLRLCRQADQLFCEPQLWEAGQCPSGNPANCLLAGTDQVTYRTLSLVCNLDLHV